MSSISRTIKHLSVSVNNTVLIQFRGRNHAIKVKALKIERDKEGNISYLLLDTYIHRDGEKTINVEFSGSIEKQFNVTGCYVSELRIVR